MYTALRSGMYDNECGKNSTKKNDVEKKNCAQCILFKQLNNYIRFREKYNTSNQKLKIQERREHNKNLKYNQNRNGEKNKVFKRNKSKEQCTTS